MLRPLLTALTTVVVALAAAGAVAEPSGALVRVGFSGNDLGVFADTRFQALGIKRMRAFAPWNVALKKTDAAYLDSWLAAARERGVEPFVTFTAAGGSACPRRPCVLPSVGRYTRAFRAFRKRWPQVRIISPWNEANHRTQPTWQNPKRAAQFHNAVRKSCRGCTIVAADVIDETNMERWLAEFKRYAKNPRLWGLHNYRDTNPRKGQRYGGTKRLLETVRGPVWLTESGGIVRFGRLFRHSEKRADLAFHRLFALAKRYRSRIQRIYIYHWYGSSRDSKFDAGILRPDGAPRPAYHTLRRYLWSPWIAL